MRDIFVLTERDLRACVHLDRAAVDVVEQAFRALLVQVVGGTVTAVGHLPHKGLCGGLATCLVRKSGQVVRPLPQADVAVVDAPVRALEVRVKGDVRCEEALDLRRDVEGVAVLGRTVQHALEHEPRVAIECGTVRPADVAEHARHARVLGTPGQHLERAGVRHHDHVRLVLPREALDRRAVEGDPVGERVLELLDGDRDGLEEAEDVREPEADELHIVVAARLQHVVRLDGGDVVEPGSHGRIVVCTCFGTVSRPRASASR